LGNPRPARLPVLAPGVIRRRHRAASPRRPRRPSGDFQGSDTSGSW
jgi:hypothetical protein